MYISRGLNLLFASTSAGANRSYYGSSYTSINTCFFRRVNLLFASTSAGANRSYYGSSYTSIRGAYLTGRVSRCNTCFFTYQIHTRVYSVLL